AVRPPCRPATRARASAARSPSSATRSPAASASASTASASPRFAPTPANRRNCSLTSSRRISAPGRSARTSRPPRWRRKECPRRSSASSSKRTRSRSRKRMSCHEVRSTSCMTSRRRRMTAHMSPHSAARRPRQARADFRAGARRAALRLVFLVVTAAPAVHAQQALIAPLEADGPVTYHIAEGAPGSMYRESGRELARWALEAWRKAAGGAIELAEAPEDEALVRIYFVPASAGQYGEMRPILVNGRRGAEVYVR